MSSTNGIVVTNPSTIQNNSSSISVNNVSHSTNTNKTNTNKTNTNTTNKTNTNTNAGKTPVKQKADILPYVITFAVLFLISLGVLTWALDLYNKSQQCAANPNIWCWDDWKCNNNCTVANGFQNPNNSPIGANAPYTTSTEVQTTAAVSGCYINAANNTGLSSCLFGSDNYYADLCILGSNTNGIGDIPAGQTGGTSCNPPANFSTSSFPNCFGCNTPNPDSSSGVQFVCPQTNSDAKLTPQCASANNQS